MPIRESLSAKPVKLSDVFSNGSRYEVPPFQRDYAWTESEWEELWLDIVAVADDAGAAQHYLGALVLQQVDGSPALRIIDGQQRLVTLSIIALAVLREIQGLIDAGIDAADNKERLRLLKEKFVSTRSPSSLMEHPRLTLNRANNAFYRTYLVQGTPRSRQGLRGAEKRLWDALTYFRGKIGERWEGKPNGEELGHFLADIVGDNLRFIEIRVGEDETAYTVFETLNARGVALSTGDLLKNYLFACASKGGDADLETAHQFWGRIVVRVPLERLSTLIFHRMAGWYPRLTEKRVFAHVKRMVPKKMSAFEYLRELDDAAALYAALDDPDDDYWIDLHEAREYLRILQFLRVEQCRSLLLTAIPALMERPSDVVQLLKRLVTLSVRSVIARVNTGDIKRAYHEAAHLVQEGKLRRPIAIVRHLRVLHVDDDQFRTAFSTIAYDPKGNRKHLVKYLLASLEAQASGRDMSFSGRVTIEHILPDSNASAYPAFDEADAQRYRIRLGNLTPLEADLNRGIGAKAFTEKAAVYARSAYALTRSIGGEEWTPAAIRERQIVMADAAVDIWPLNVGDEGL